jgi:hypothetical protein
MIYDVEETFFDNKTAGLKFVYVVSSTRGVCGDFDALTCCRIKV